MVFMCFLRVVREVLYCGIGFSFGMLGENMLDDGYFEKFLFLVFGEVDLVEFFDVLDFVDFGLVG